MENSIEVGAQRDLECSTVAGRLLPPPRPPPTFCRGTDVSPSRSQSISSLLRPIFSSCPLIQHLGGISHLSSLRGVGAVLVSCTPLSAGPGLSPHPAPLLFCRCPVWRAEGLLRGVLGWAQGSGCSPWLGAHTRPRGLFGVL